MQRCHACCQGEACAYRVVWLGLEGVILDLLQTGGLLRSLGRAGSFLGLQRERWPAGRTLGGGQAGQAKEWLAKPPQARNWVDSPPPSPPFFGTAYQALRSKCDPPAVRPRGELRVVPERGYSISRTPGRALRPGEQLFITSPDNKRTQAGFPAARRFRVDTKKDFQ